LTFSVVLSGRLSKVVSICLLVGRNVDTIKDARLG